MATASRPSPSCNLACGLLLVLSLGLPACTLGLQQAAIVPGIRGAWQFTGVDLSARNRPEATDQPFELEVQLPPRSGRVESLRTAPQLMLGVDLPFARASIAPAIVSDGRIDYIQLDLLYKHALGDEDEPIWRVLAGFTAGIVEARVDADYALELEQPVTVGGAIIQSGDTARYQAAEMLMGWYATVGFERELYEWLHAYVQFNARLTGQRQRGEDLTITAREGSTTDGDDNRESETFHLLTDDRFEVAARQQGTLSSNIDLPSFAAMVGISVTFPTWGAMRRVARAASGRPAEVPPRPYVAPPYVPPPVPQQPPVAPDPPAPQAPAPVREPPPAAPVEPGPPPVPADRVLEPPPAG